jgi:hypothetical protein
MDDVTDEEISNWEVAQRFLPPGWEAQMRELGLLKFGRKFAGETGPAALLRTMLLHVAGNVSLRTACALARAGGIAELSDVALLKRLQKAAPWFTWATQALLEAMASPLAWPTDPALAAYHWRIVDATVVSEPGETGSLWRLHFAIDARTLAPEQVIVDTVRRGERLSHFAVRAGDVLLGDRVYATRAGLAQLATAGALALCRFVPGNVPLLDAKGRPFPLRQRLRHLREGAIGHYRAYFHYGQQTYPVRVCALRKSPAATAEAEAQVRRQAQKHGIKEIRQSTLDDAAYVLLITTLPETVSAAQALAIYRYRWQVELLFKRLKGLLELSPLYKRSDQGMRGWLSGKIFAATLATYMAWYAEAFSPWGYPLPDVPCPRRADITAC